MVADTAQSTKTGSIYSLALHTGSGAAPAPDHTLGSEAVGPSAPFTFTSARHGRYRRNCHTLTSLQSDGNYCRLSSSAYDTSAVHTHARTRTHTHTHNLLPNLSGLPMSQVFYYCLKFPDTDKAEQVFKCLINTQQQDNDYSFISVKGHCSQSQKCTGDLSRQEFQCSWCF